MQKVEFAAMGSQILIALDSEDPGVIPVAEAAAGWFEDWEKIFSRFKTDTEISRLNSQRGKSAQVSEPMWEVLSLAGQIEKWTEGLVTPLVLDALENAGYELNFDELPMDQLRDSFAAGEYLGDADALSLDPSTRSIKLPVNKRIDLGGIAKGWAAHQTMLKLQHIAPVLVDAGGDIAISAPRVDGSCWQIGVARSFHETENAEVVEVGQGGIATSGIDRRRWKMNGKWQHHIIDPRRNLPAETDVISATVIAKDVMTAEAAAKMVILLGSEKGTQWLSSQGLNEYLLQLESAVKERIFGYLSNTTD